MTPEFWRENIIESVKDIADKGFQRRAWFAKSKEVSSPEEVYAHLLDDFTFKDFLANEDVGLTDNQKGKGRDLIEILDSYASTNKQVTDPYSVIDDPEWEKVREVARNFLSSLDNSKKG